MGGGGREGVLAETALRVGKKGDLGLTSEALFLCCMLSGMLCEGFCLLFKIHFR